MEAIAKLKNVPTSPRKMRLIADLIRGKRVNSALNQLKFDSKYSSRRIEKLLLSLDTEKMDIIFESVASKRFGWTKYQPIRMLYRDFSSKSVFLQGWPGSKSKQARFFKFSMFSKGIDPK